MIDLIKQEGQQLLDRINAGNTNITEKDQMLLLDTIRAISDQKLSKYQVAQLLNCSTSKVDSLVSQGKLPKSESQAGFKEVFWYKSDVVKYIEKERQKKKHIIRSH